MINKTQFKPFDIVYHDEIFEYNYHFLCDTPDPNVVWILISCSELFTLQQSARIHMYNIFIDEDII